MKKSNICNNKQTETSYNMKDSDTMKQQFLKCYDKYSDDIFRFCLVKTRNRATALDITQDTFMKFWESLQKGTQIDQERAYVYKIARNLIIDQSRKKQADLVEDFNDGIYDAFLQEDPYERLQNKIDGEKALTLLQELPESSRELIILRYVQGLSIQEIALLTNKDSKTVSVYLHRSLEKLRNIFETYEKK